MYYILRVDTTDAANGVHVEIVGKSETLGIAKLDADALTDTNPHYTHVVVNPLYAVTAKILLTRTERPEHIIEDISH